MNHRRARLLYWALFALIAGSLIVRIRLHGLAFPPPWPDESSFLWPALAFRDTGTLFAPELFRRELFWMPPGYMVTSGAIFALTGFSFEWARTLSGLYLCGAFACVCAIGRELRVGFGCLALALVFLQSPIAAMAANTARMETLMLLVAAGGFLLLERGLRASALSVLALAPLVHPNGVFPLCGGAALCLFPTRSNLARLRPHRLELLAIAGSAAAWLGYAVHVVPHFDLLEYDWLFQLKWKKFQAVNQDALRLPDLWIVGIVLILSAIAAKQRVIDARRAVPLLALAASLWLQTCVTVGWLYEVHGIFMDFIAAILGAELAGAWLGRRFEQRPSLARAAPLGLAVAFAILSARFVVTSSFAMRSVTPSVQGIWPAPPAYMQAEDRAAVGEYLKRLANEGRPISVTFLPDAEALAFQEFRTSTLRFKQLAYGVEFADVYIFHDSRWLPPLLRGLSLLRLAMHHKIPLPLERWQVIRERDGTESWRVFRRWDPRLKSSEQVPAPAP